MEIHRRHEQWRRDHLDEYVEEAKANDAVVADAEKNECDVFHSVPQWDAIKGLYDMKTKFDFIGSHAVLVFRHGKYTLGSVSIQLGVVGWLLSESECRLNGSPCIDVKWSGGLDRDLCHGRYDPAHLGAQTTVIVRGLRKEIL